MDGAGLPGGDLPALCALVQWLGPARRLGHGRGPWHLARLNARRLGTGTAIFGSSFAIYNGVTAFIANVLVAVVLSALLPNTAKDETWAEDYADLPEAQLAQ